MEWSFLINLVTQLLEDIFTLWAATFDQPPLSFPLPSWELMIPHGSGQRMTRKHSSSPIVAGGNSGGKTPRLDESTTLHSDYTEFFFYPAV